MGERERSANALGLVLVANAAVRVQVVGAHDGTVGEEHGREALEEELLLSVSLSLDEYLGDVEDMLPDRCEQILA